MRLSGLPQLHKPQAGWWLIELALSLWVMIMITTTTVLILNSISHLPFSTSKIQNLLGLEQLRLHLALAYEIEVYPDELVYQLNEEEFHLALVNQRLIQTPGTYIFLIELQNVEFFNEGDQIFLEWTNDEKTYRYWLAKQ